MKSNFTCAVLLVALSFSASRSAAQTVDSALVYFPLHDGDQWEYGYRWAIMSNYTYLLAVTIGSDTLLPNGSVYKKEVRRQLPDGPVEYSFIRIDSASGCVYACTADTFHGEHLVVDLRANPGDSSGTYVWYGGASFRTVLGESVQVKSYSGFTGDYNSHTLAYGIGLIFMSEAGSLDYPNYTELKYASINGRVYGTYLGVNKESLGFPKDFELLQNYPNPFNPSTTIRFSVPEQCRVRVTIFNLLGQRVAELANEEMSAGNFERVWNANVASGLYFYRLEAVSVNDPGKRFVDVKKMVLVR